MRKILALALIMIGTISAQIQYELIKSHLPENHLNVISEQTIAAQLERDAALDPLLIYLRLNYWNKLLGENIRNDKDNGLQFIKYHLNNKYTERNNWFKVQRKILESNYKYDPYFENVMNDLNGFMTKSELSETDAVQETAADENLLNYFSYIFLTEEQGLEFDPDINYFYKYENSKADYIDKLLKINNEFQTKYAEQDDNFSYNLLRRWYILKEKEELLPDVPSILINYYTNYYSSLRESTFEIRFGYFNKLYHNTFDMKFNSPERDIPIDVGDTKDLNNFTLHLGYKYFIRNTVSILSYIQFNLLLTYGMSKAEIDTVAPYYERYDVAGDRNFISERYVFHNPEISNYRKYGSYLLVKTPLYIINPNLYLESGALLGMDILSYGFSLEYDFVRIKVNPNPPNQRLEDKQGVPYSEKFTDYFFYITPVLAFNFKPVNYLNIHLLLGYNASDLSIGLNF